MVSIGELRVVVAEDNGFLRWTAGSALERLGVKHFVLAENGLAALEQVRDAQAPIDIVITDVDMPLVDGIELIRRLGRAKSQASVVLMSALDWRVLAAVDAMARCCGVHVAAAIEKPVKVEVLREALMAHQRRDSTANLAEAATPEPGGLHIAGSAAPGRAARLGRETLALALLECRDRRKAGRDAPASVALALACMQEPGFAHELHDALAEISMEPRHVALHLDEMPAPESLPAVMENVARLRMKGFALVLPYRLRYGLESPFAAPALRAQRASFSRGCARAYGDSSDRATGQR